MAETRSARDLLRGLPADVGAALVARGRSSRQPPILAGPVRYRAERRTRFLDGRLATSAAMQCLGVDDQPVGSAPSGEPLWPPGIVGSISHARELSVAVVAESSHVGGIGVDVEDDRVIDGIESLVLGRGESRWLTSSRGGERRRRLIQAFSAKEAVYKAYFPRVRQFFGFDAVVLTPAPGGFEAEFTVALDGARPAGRPFFVASRWSDDLVASWTIVDRD